MQHEGVEVELQGELALEQVRVLDAGVAHELALDRAGRSRRVADQQRIDRTALADGEPLPAHAVLHVEHGVVGGALHGRHDRMRDAAGAGREFTHGGRRGDRHDAEQLIHGDAEVVHQGVQGGDRGLGLPGLDLGDEAGRDAQRLSRRCAG